MIYSLTWLPEVLLGAGLKVAQTPDWQSRGRGPMGAVRGVMCHHTATSARGNMPSLGLLINGRSDLPGPLAQLGLGRDGCFYAVAAGRANHAGRGSWEGITTGNSSFIGIEAENDGVGEPWPAVQLDAYQRGVAAILARLGAGANMCCAHREYALPHGRKTDPDFDMPGFRSEVEAYLAGKTPKPLIPSADATQRPTLRRGQKGPFVVQAQRLLGLDPDGFLGPGTEAALRDFQRQHELVPDGILGPKSWQVLDADGSAGARPSKPSAPSVPPAVPARQAPAATPLPEADTPARRPAVAGRKATGPGGECFAVVQGKGFYTIGETTLSSWIGDGAGHLGDIPRPVGNVVATMSTVEGGLEAVNSYDDAHLSFGVFQWTAGGGDDEGELAVLLALLKGKDPAAFQDCFGRYGLDAAVAGPQAVTGHIILDGAVLRTSEEKSELRKVEWAYRFWRSGKHESMRACQFLLAARRIDRFKVLPVFGTPVEDWMSSELGVALVLDEHVNRPGHVPATLQRAIDAIGMQHSDPRAWTDEQEQALIGAYLTQRAATSMTDSNGRAARIERRGTLSERRGSFRGGA